MSDFIFSQILAVGDVQDPMQPVVSRPREPPPQPLAERYMNLSIHTAPIRPTRLPYQPASGQIASDSQRRSLPGICTPEPCVCAMT